MTHRPDDLPPDAPNDEYWELLRGSLRTALGRPAEPGAPEPEAGGERARPAELAPPEAERPPSERSVERYGWGM